ncbi:MAG: ATP-dependent DNA helicase [Clostridia bacterium]|nr:ATP-dependent DNA helicase [Clostridia bacterium]
MRYDVTSGHIDISAEALCRRVFLSRSTVEARRHEVRALRPALAAEFFDVRAEGIMLQHTVDYGTLSYRLSGEVDLLGEEGSAYIGVIRPATSGNFNNQPDEEYTAYIKCCALLYCLREDLPSVSVRVLVKNTESGETRWEAATYQAAQLFSFVLGLLSRVAGEALWLRERETSIRPSARDVVFPYGEIRDGQDELIHRCFSVIKQGKRLFAQAPTGIGKTISTLYPAVRAYGRGLCDKIFYFTAKASTTREAYNAAGRLYEAGARLRTVILTAKEQMCPSGRCGKYCNPRECSNLRSYGDRVEAAIQELMSRQNGYYADVIREVAAKHEICPYELSLDLSERCDLIICDYNYLFDPMVYLRRYFEKAGDFGQYVFLVDEAHNLVERARTMYSVGLCAADFTAFLETIPETEKALRDAVMNMGAAFDAARLLCRDSMHADGAGREIGYYVSRNRVNLFCDAVTVLGEKCAAWLRANRYHEFYDAVDGFYASIRKYLCILDYYDDRFMTYVEVAGDAVSVSLNCMDPSEILDGCMRKGRASVLFSATLTPTSYFSDVLGGGKDAVCMELPSPYDPERLCLAAVDTVSTRFEDRDGNCRKIATLIAAAVSPKAGNYIAYFPSYDYLQKVHEAFVKKYPKVKTVLQRRGMTRAERDEFIASFREDEGRMRIGFCVLGGSFSEGVDLPGSRLIGSIIVGVGLPGFSSERNLMRDYFENRYENGFDYAYTFPGMNGVLQAAGRVIRTEEDRGIVVLIDDRYGTPTYQKLFPSHWKHLKYAGNSLSLAEIARKFWEKS